MRASQNSLFLPVICLVVLITLIKNARGSGTFEVELDVYEEHSKDLSIKCISLCVTSSPSGIPRCNLNTSTGQSTVDPVNPNGRISFPIPYQYEYSFARWEDNSELSVTVWNRPAGQSCATSSPRNTTIHGTAHKTIPRSSHYRYYNITDPQKKWTVWILTQIICTTTDCLLPCIPRDNSTGHYTCEDGNKKCLAVWYGPKCLKTCVSPNDPPGHYICSRTGVKGCLTNWYGENCTIFLCNTGAATYRCSENGTKTCLPNWFGEKCSKFCNETARYTCDKNGQKQCLTNWYDSNCSTFCNGSALTFNCSKNGEKICLNNWFDKNCSTFCDQNATNYKCTSNGKRNCSSHWFGDRCDKYCNQSATNYKCLENGNIECFQNWHGEGCLTYCTNSTEAATYTCNVKGEKVQCTQNWYGDDCVIVCNSSPTYDWYAPNCTTHCNNSAITFTCSGEGKRTCLSDLYLCEVNEGSTVRCPENIQNGKTRSCSSSCITSEGKDLEYFLAQCKSNGKTTRLCSRNTTDVPRCERNPADSEKTSSAQKAVIWGSSVGAVLFFVVLVAIIINRVFKAKKRNRVNVLPVGESSEPTQTFNIA